MTAPDTSHTPSYIGQVVVEILYSQHKNFRAVITIRQDGSFQIRMEKWELGDWEFIGKGYWNSQERSATFTDQLEAARALAREKLHGSPDGLDSEVSRTDS
jgi:hypothetical protein